MKKVFLFLFMIFIFFQVSASSVNALECSIGCKQNGATSDLRCYYQSPIQKIGSVYSTCMINPQNDGTTSAWSYGASCYDATNNNFCKSNGCPTTSDNSDVANQNGATCKVILPCVSGSSCSSKDYDGKWDASESRCVICGSNKESIICGDSAGIYIGDGTNVYSPNINCPNFIWCSKAGDQQFDSACGADSACDEKAQGDSCGTDYVCDANGKCVFKTPSTCNYNNIQDNDETGVDCGGGGCPACASICIQCPDGTAKGACNSAGKRCNEVSGSCILQSDVSCVTATGCSAYSGNEGNCNNAGGV